VPAADDERRTSSPAACLRAWPTGRSGLLEQHDGRLRFTETGFFLSDALHDLQDSSRRKATSTSAAARCCSR
jgi:hypothetical protein